MTIVGRKWPGYAGQTLATSAPAQGARHSQDLMIYGTCSSKPAYQSRVFGDVIMVNWREQALAQACAVCSPKTKVNECNCDFSPNDRRARIPIRWRPQNAQEAPPFSTGTQEGFSREFFYGQVS